MFLQKKKLILKMANDIKLQLENQTIVNYHGWGKK